MELKYSFKLILSLKKFHYMRSKSVISHFFAKFKNFALIELTEINKTFKKYIKSVQFCLLNHICYGLILIFFKLNINALNTNEMLVKISVLKIYISCRETDKNMDFLYALLLLLNIALKSKLLSFFSFDSYKI